MRTLLLVYSILFSGMVAQAQCLASFTGTRAPLNNYLLRYSFNNTSTYGTLGKGQYVVYNYTFGDGNTSGLVNPFHEYAATGTYSVGMRITRYDSSNNPICSDSTTRSVVVSYDSCAVFMVITGSLASGTRYLAASSPTGAAGMHYSWDFGDGTYDTGASVTHTYTARSIFAPKVTATRSGSLCSSTNTGSTGVPYLGLFCDSLNIQLSVWQAAGTYNVDAYPYPENFPSTVETISLDYGDGTPPTSSWSHTYAGPGTYHVTLRSQWIDSLTSAFQCADSITETVTVSSVPSYLQGVIWYDSLVHTGTQSNIQVYLIQFDSVTNTLAAVDSTLVGGKGWIYYSFSGVPAGNYLVKAARQYATGGSAGLVPTYGDSSLLWSTAQMVSHPGRNWVDANIWMRSGTATSGPGFIGGNVSLGANKGSGNGVAGITILLRKTGGDVVAATITDADGNFSFEKIPVGVYSIYPEAINYKTMAATATITAASSTVNGINFNQDPIKKTIATRSLSAETIAVSAANISLAPNPASKSVTISWSGYSTEDKMVVITNAFGQTVFEKVLRSAAAVGNLNLDISRLRAGVYFVQLKGSVAYVPARLVVQ